jgi:hypothetical protein
MRLDFLFLDFIFIGSSLFEFQFPLTFLVLPNQIKVVIVKLVVTAVVVLNNLPLFLFELSLFPAISF